MPSHSSPLPTCVPVTTLAVPRGSRSWGRRLLQVALLCLNAGVVLGMVGCGGSGSDQPHTSATASLSNITLSGGLLNPAFRSDTTTYSTMFIATNNVTITPTAPAGSTITINGTPVASGATSGLINLPSGNSTITLEVSAPNSTSRTYTITAHQLGQDAYVKTSNTNAGDSLGYSLALSGDTLAVGAFNEASNASGVNGNESDNSAVGSGAVYVFTRSGSTWTQQAYLKASNSSAADFFGSSVALSGDTLAVGAPAEASNATGVNGNQSDNTANQSGAVYVFTRSGGLWSQQAYVKASNSAAGDFFGVSIALSGDTLAVGAHWEASNASGVNGNQADNTAFQSGAVYVFTRNGGVWSQQAYVKASNSAAGDLFGSSVALSGDTLAVGAASESSNATGINGNQADNNAGNSGAAYVFTRNAGVWSQQAYVKASNSAAGDLFGSSLALSGDTLAVGAASESSNATGINGNQADNTAFQSGAVYVFTRSGGVWSQQAYVKASNSAAGDLFGSSLALSGDTLAVGAAGESSAAYVFTRNGDLWSQQAYVKASNAQASDRFGLSVALSGDTLAVGADQEDSNATGVNGNQSDNSASNSGAVYIFR